MNLLWGQTLGARYERTHIRIFRDSIESACGSAESAAQRVDSFRRGMDSGDLSA